MDNIKVLYGRRFFIHLMCWIFRFDQIKSEQETKSNTHLRFEQDRVVEGAIKIDNRVINTLRCMLANIEKCYQPLENHHKGIIRNVGKVVNDHLLIELSFRNQVQYFTTIKVSSSFIHPDCYHYKKQYLITPVLFELAFYQLVGHFITINKNIYPLIKRKTFIHSQSHSSQFALQSKSQTSSSALKCRPGGQVL